MFEKGTKLKNGATVIRALYDTDKGGFVLAETNGLSAHKYATWAVSPEGVTVWGNYFHDYDEALADLRSRANAF